MESGARDDTHADGPVPEPRTVDVPTGTTMRLVVLIAAVIASASFVFTLFYLASPEQRTRQVDAMQSCFAREPLLGQGIDTAVDVQLHAAAVTRVSRCVAPAAMAQVTWVGYGLVLLFALAAVLYWAYPRWIVRRHGLVPLENRGGSELLRYLDGLSGQVGLPRPPTWLLAPNAGTTEGLAFGHRKQPCVLLNAGLVTMYTTDRAAFRAVLSHELAHLSNRDVHKTYLAMAIWWAFVGVAIVPSVVLGAADVLGGRSWLADEGWSDTLRVYGALVTLVALVYLSRNGFLRARELQADAFAARHEHALRHLLSRFPTPPPPRSWASRMGTHPLPGHRLAAVDDPAVLSRPSPVELGGAGITAGVLAANIDYVFGLYLRPNIMLVRGVVGLLIGLVLTGLLGVTLWRAVIGNPSRPLPWWAWSLPAVALGVGFVAGERLSIVQIVVAAPVPGFANGLTNFLFVIILLLVAGVLLAGWTVSASRFALDPTGSSHRLSSPTVIAAVSLAAAPWFATWFVARDLGLALWAVNLGDVPAVGAEIDWYRTLAQWSDLGWPPLTFLGGNPFTLPTLALLWVVPLAVLLRRGGRIGPALLAGLVGGLASIAGGIGLSYAARSTLSVDIRSDTAFSDQTSPFFYVLFTSHVTLTILAQAVVAAVVAARAHRLRPALVLLAVFVTGTIAGIGWHGILLFDLCALDLFGTGPAPCVPPSALAEVSRNLHAVLLKGLLVTIPTAVFGAALGMLYRRRTATATPTAGASPNRSVRALATVTLVLLSTVTVIASLAQLPRSRDVWAAVDGEVGTTDTAPSGAGTSTPPAPSTETTPSPPTQLDACVVGEWTETRGEAHLILPSGTSIKITGSGATQELRANGRGRNDYGAGYVMSGVIPSGNLRGQELEVSVTGTGTFSYRTIGSEIYFSEYSHIGTRTTRLNGRVLETSTPVLSEEPHKYTCRGDELTQTQVSSSERVITHLRRLDPPN